MIIGIDHGYYAIKTKQVCFPTGLMRYTYEPYTMQNVLQYGGAYYVCGTGRQTLVKDKTANDNYYLLTLAALAQEIRKRKGEKTAKVVLAAGLPLAGFGREKQKFKEYLFRKEQPVRFFYEGERYYALNLHAVFSKGTLEWRCFESTLHAGKVRANITLALAISAQAINQKCTQMRKTEITENPAFTFRTFLLRLGLIGPEYKNVREHLLANLEGDRAWRYDRSTYECLNRNHRAEDAR